MIAGIEQPSEGRLYMGNEEVHFRSTSDARRYGIGIIHQELSLFPNLPVYQNIFMAKEKKRGFGMDNKYHREKAAEILKKLEYEVGKEHIVLDLSCRRKGDVYYIVTDRWQRFTDVEISRQTLSLLSQHCSEFLIHAVDVEGKSGGIDETLTQMIGSFRDIPVTYAGGVRNLEDVEKLYRAGGGYLDITIGSALDLFGGSLKYEDVIRYCKKLKNT